MVMLQTTATSAELLDQAKQVEDVRTLGGLLIVSA